jgi:hypothetical protein
MATACQRESRKSPSSSMMNLRWNIMDNEMSSLLPGMAGTHKFLTAFHTCIGAKMTSPDLNA